MRFIKRLFIFLLICLLGWETKYIDQFDCECDKYTISINEIFQQKEHTYGVLFFLDGCIACRNTKIFLQKDCELFYRKFYYISLEKNVVSESDEFYSNIGVNDYKKIKISMAPTLLIVENYVVINQLVGYQKIVNYYASS